MSKKFAALSGMAVAVALAACSGGGGSQPSGASMLPMNVPLERGQMMMTIERPDSLPPNTVGEELPSEGVGSVHSAKFDATVGGFTQTTHAQVLAFPPGTKITIRNLSKTDPHTFNVVEEIKGPPAHFPANPTLSTTAHGNGIVGVGFASGVIEPGKSVKVTLAKPGIYLIGCAFHYSFGMQDVLIVEKGAKPGSEATPTPGPQSSPTPTPTPGGGGGGW